MTNTVREAVQMVLTRMETHPEDFYDDMRISGRFTWVWNAIRPNTEHQYGLNEAELAAIRQGYDKLMYRKFHDRVLESMLNDPKQDEMLKRQGSSLKYNPSKLLVSPSTLEAAAKLLSNNARKTP